MNLFAGYRGACERAQPLLIASERVFSYLRRFKDSLGGICIFLNFTSFICEKKWMQFVNFFHIHSSLPIKCIYFAVMSTEFRD